MHLFGRAYAEANPLHRRCRAVLDRLAAETSATAQLCALRGHKYVVVDSSDGFYIAEMDMKLRGPGEFFGTRQSGLPALRIANILRDQEILEVARHEAMAFVDQPPSPDDLRRAVGYIQNHWQRRYGLVQVG